MTALSSGAAIFCADEAEFPYIKEQTGATAGNLSVQIDKLSTAGYIEIEKTFKGKRPCTICRITQKGRQAFEQYVEALRDYLEVVSKGRKDSSASLSRTDIVPRP